jgi:hypothetical protein
MTTNLSALTTLSHDEMSGVNGGSDFWNDFWDGVLDDLIDFRIGFGDAVRGR